MVLVDSLFVCKLIFFLVPLNDVKGEARAKAKIEAFGVLLVPGIGDTVSLNLYQGYLFIDLSFYFALIK